MARIPYPDLGAAAIAPLVERITAERGKVLNLYGMLLHSPPVAEGWLAFLTAIRQKCQLSARIRELAIMRIAALNGAEYEFRSHTPFALKEGISEQQINVLRTAPAGNEGALVGFDDVERRVLVYCDSMTRDIHVPQAIFEAIQPHFDARELVELTATIGAYNLVSRFLEAMQVDHE